MPPKKILLYDAYFRTHFNLTYNDIFRDTFDTHENRYKRCCTEYMKGIKYNRSKRKYVNTSNKYVFWAAVDKLKFEEKDKVSKTRLDIV